MKAPIIIQHLKAYDWTILSSYSSIYVLVDENTKLHCYPLLEGYLPTHRLIQIESGELHKNLQTCSYIWGALSETRADRHALLINLGGGVIGDMGGFCAATYKRGIDFLQFPTTLLSQVDASVGGKLGIDFMGYKNQIGAFGFAKEVVIVPEFLKTLEKRQLYSGWAEVLKHSYISKSFDVGQWRPDNATDHLDLIKGAVDVKMDIVTRDPYEKGERKLLNFGHTLGHAVESYLLEKGDRMILHGEAVALGMYTEAYISMKYLGLAEDAFHELAKTLKTLYNKVSFDKEEIGAIIQWALQDKKNIGGKVKSVMLKAIGDAIYDYELNMEQMRESLLFYSEFY